jgi:bifunctional non-homologous end joining protein LigD
MAALEQRLTHDEAHAWCRDVAEQVAKTDPRRYTLSATADREGRLFLDYLRNGRGTTAIGAFSPRAWPGFPIARPVTWAQVRPGVASDAFTMAKPKGIRRAAAGKR